ncbi:unnamed protein product [Heterobilharzia americana]|nr:unnamed protein product [Heterobilharzia americana]
MTLRCGSFFSRTHNGLLNSPYQSDVSQSAPSSPTIDTYETLPLVPNAASIARVPVSLPVDPSQLRTTLCTNSFQSSHKNDSHNQFERKSTTNGTSERCSESMLLCLMQRLGVESVWPCLLEHGVADVKRLSRLTRNELIEMGVTDAETRATLMTAAQLLTDSWLNPALFHKALNKPNLKNTNDMLEIQNLHDSGISSGTDIGGSYSSQKPQTVNFLQHSTDLSTDHFKGISLCQTDQTEQNPTRWNYSRKQCNTGQIHQLE